MPFEKHGSIAWAQARLDARTQRLTAVMVLLSVLSIVACLVAAGYRPNQWDSIAQVGLGALIVLVTANASVQAHHQGRYAADMQLALQQHERELQDHSEEREQVREALKEQFGPTWRAILADLTLEHLGPLAKGLSFSEDQIAGESVSLYGRLQGQRRAERERWLEENDPEEFDRLMHEESDKYDAAVEASIRAATRGEADEQDPAPTSGLTRMKAWFRSHWWALRRGVRRVYPRVPS